MQFSVDGGIRNMMEYKMMTKEEMIEELDGYFAGERMFAIELAVDAVEYLSQRPEPIPVLLQLQRWLVNSDPRMPEELAHELHDALRKATP
jgi:hypothetical protein